MLAVGNLILFTPFHFKNGNPPQDKFFVVLGVSNNSTILASLPTSVNKAPSLIDKLHGCVNHDERCYNCYVYEPNRVICDSGFSFNLPTFIYGNDIEDYQITTLQKKYQTKGKDYQLIGALLPNEFQSLMQCIQNSGSIKRSIRRALFPI